MVQRFPIHLVAAMAVGAVFVSAGDMAHAGTTVRDHRGGDVGFPSNAQGGRTVTPTTGLPRRCSSGVAHSGPCNPWGGARDHRH